MREGAIPTVLGALVTAGAATMRARDIKKRGMKQKDIVPMIETGLVGFGLAHIVLGAIDLVEHR
jgi:hypothetical protein